MKRSFPVIAAVAAMVMLSACHSSKQSTGSGSASAANDSEEYPYRASATKSFDLIHTRLDVSLDWGNKYLLGEAEITLKPRFYPSSTLVLDARGMIINEVKKVAGGSKSELPYQYRNDSLIITLDRIYRRQDTLKIFIDYVARPDELPKGGSMAITEDKGLYFINADGSEEGKPRQVWTQGETQASSAWFPTIDRPNQKSTQEIYITVDTAFTTLSNGIKLSSIVNGHNGTRTDYWRQDLPHAPYLFMMAVGEFAVVTDTWKGKEVSYYVEKEYEPYARNIFGNTPEMLDFFSRITGVDYPWAKYSQIVVRDYVSGAMENTTATIFGEFMHQNAREQLDNRTEDVVSHELFHHWFGDLVTCESWSNISLNESFATYGEYLWNEYKYGKDFADQLGEEDLKAYLKEAKNKQVDLIRYHYDRQEDVFDRHSYQKGGRILHMLRSYVGDEAFFEGFRVYLERYRFKTAEAHDLRLVFEEVTGEDLNWFFNQWYFDKGHPNLKITHDWNADSSTCTVRVQQLQDLKTTPLYRLPVDIDIYSATGVTRHRINITEADQSFRFPLPAKPFLVNFDSRKSLLCTKEDVKSEEEWAYQFHHAPLFLDRFEALTNVGEAKGADGVQMQVLLQAFQDPSPRIREAAVNRSSERASLDVAGTRKTLSELVLKDENPAVRAAALVNLVSLFPSDTSVYGLMKKALNDSSYQVMGAGAAFLMATKPEEATPILKALETAEDGNVRDIVAGIYAVYGGDAQAAYMSDRLKHMKGEERYYALQEYGKFLERCSPEEVTSRLELLSSSALHDKMWTDRLSATLALESISKNYGVKPAEAPLVSGPGDKAEMERHEVKSAAVRNKSKDLLQVIYSSETNEDLKKIYGTRK